MSVMRGKEVVVKAVSHDGIPTYNDMPRKKKEYSVTNNTESESQRHTHWSDIVQPALSESNKTNTCQQARGCT
jgi:hypothetical protein